MQVRIFARRERRFSINARTVAARRFRSEANTSNAAVLAPVSIMMSLSMDSTFLSTGLSYHLELTPSQDLFPLSFCECPHRARTRTRTRSRRAGRPRSDRSASVSLRHARSAAPPNRIPSNRPMLFLRFYVKPALRRAQFYLPCFRGLTLRAIRASRQSPVFPVSCATVPARASPRGASCARSCRTICAALRGDSAARG